MSLETKLIILTIVIVFIIGFITHPELWKLFVETPFKSFLSLTNLTK